MQNNAALEEKTVILELKHIYKDYIQGSMVVPVLKDINLQVEKGEYLAIMGPSGSGKSTLMNIVGCLDRATKGEFILDGHMVGGMKDNDLADLGSIRSVLYFRRFSFCQDRLHWIMLHCR